MPERRRWMELNEPSGIRVWLRTDRVLSVWEYDHAGCIREGYENYHTTIRYDEGHDTHLVSVRQSADEVMGLLGHVSTATVQGYPQRPAAEIPAPQHPPTDRREGGHP